MQSSQDIRYAKSGDGYIAYRVLGEGPVDLLMLPALWIPLEAVEDLPRYKRYVEKLSSFVRLIQFDRRGLGLSDPLPATGADSLEAWMEDAKAVADAVGSEKVAWLAADTASRLACLFATTWPDRTHSLALIHPTASGGSIPGDYWTQLSTGNQEMERWDFLGKDADAEFREWYERWRRRTASPAAARAVWEAAHESDVSEVLPSIRVPTLVLIRRDNHYVIGERSRAVAAAIPSAKLVELDGDDHFQFLGNQDELLEEIEEFLTGKRAAVRMDRVLASLVFSDIVESSSRTAEVGDRNWRDLLDRHDAILRRQLEKFGGREVKHTGDGVLASFEGPGRALQYALALRETTQQLGLTVRAGIHVGEVERRGDDLTGIAVVIARRVCDEAKSGEIFVSRTVVDLVAGSGIPFIDVGPASLRGLPGEWHLFSVGL